MAKRRFKVPLASVRQMREAVRFGDVSFEEAGAPHGYSRGAAYNTILIYERRKGLRPDQREPEEDQGGGKVNYYPPPSGISPATQSQDTVVASLQARAALV